MDNWLILTGMILTFLLALFFLGAWAATRKPTPRHTSTSRTVKLSTCDTERCPVCGSEDEEMRS